MRRADARLPFEHCDAVRRGHPLHQLSVQINTFSVRRALELTSLTVPISGRSAVSMTAATTVIVSALALAFSTLDMLASVLVALSGLAFSCVFGSVARRDASIALSAVCLLSYLYLHSAGLSQH